ncbi:aldehyde dehydrogenase [Pseudalkalibacillus berkeleyi]|uniref:Aldehyde dehydrogenase n=1 Tax=Pseudalkalibacillus berkeleyi TaxID=1069813 RepID=A0ABS9H3W9_9BACL|nr:aldehyde dehydrogenase [Pseudalkalibacillus berkeleyi]MCF6138614.1 aldehyde dehydrogenase [Pseudalkalibacillus berkeleyi]
MKNIETIIKNQKQYFFSGETKSTKFRINQLNELRKAIQRYEPEIVGALKKDLNKSEFEAYSTEIGMLYKEINFAINKITKWMKPERVSTPLTHIGTKSYIYPEPYGVSLIIAPWNYPFSLQISPLIGAIAAGNCAVVKPSELTPTVSKVIYDMFQELYEERYIAVVEGGVEVSQKLLEQDFDKIFFTGSVNVGKIVMEAASKKLIPVTLELGGKSPAIVDESADLMLAAKRIIWGKFTNAGQTCIAPDYLYVQKEVKDELTRLMEDAIEELYGKNPLNNKEMTRIVNENHFNRLSRYLVDGRVIKGGKVDRNLLAIEPTLIDSIDWDAPVMQDEIFGPILPILEFNHLDEVIENVRAHPKPLALYMFTETDQNQEKIIESLSFGGGCINDTLIHIATPYLPFGGVGQSGTGSYHGKASFDAFSHEKSVVQQTNRFDIKFRYPSHKYGLSIMKKLLK